MSQLWPVPNPGTLTRQVWDVETARALPGVGRALALYGLIATCPLEDYAGVAPRLPRPRLLTRPDPEQSLPWWIGVHVDDYLLHGNALHMVTVRDAARQPYAAKWFPAHRWTIKREDGTRAYYLDGKGVPSVDVVHVQRGADPVFPERGVGVVEQHVRALDRAGLQEAAESEGLRSRGMPGVAVISPGKELDPEDADDVADKWVDRFRGPVPKPAIFPAGTQVIPLAWSPTDQQLTQARNMSLVDVANAFNLDGYWLGAAGSSHTYRSPGALYLALLRTSLNRVIVELEDCWSWSWLPHGRRVKVDTTGLMKDDLVAMIRGLREAVDGGLWTVPEARAYMGLDPSVTPERPAAPAPIEPAEKPDEDDVDDDVDDEEDDDNVD